MIILSQDYLNTRLLYHPDTGDLYWKPVPETDKASRIFNICWAGKKAGGISKALGYVILGIDNKQYWAHRVIWCMVYGVFPDAVDHINRQRSDNRLLNLREATHSDNRCNKPRQSNNSSGFKGVSWNKGKWIAQIQKDGIHVCLGRYSTPEEASIAYNNAAVNIHGDFICLE